MGWGRWEPWEDELLRDGTPGREVAARTGHTERAVAQRRLLLGLTTPCAPPWEPWEDELLREGWAACDVAKATGRTVFACNTRRSKLKRRGGAEPSRLKWSEHELDTLMHLGVDEAMWERGCSREACERKRRRMFAELKRGESK